MDKNEISHRQISLSDLKSKLVLLAFVPIMALVLAFGFYLDYSISPFSSTTASILSTTAEWTSTFTSGFSAGDGEVFHIPTNGSLILYVRYYYYNPNSTLALDFGPLGQVVADITGYGLYGTSANYNFTIRPNATSITIGGPDNLNEGTLVQFSISPNKGINGTYEMQLGISIPSQEICVTDFTIVIGNGVPNYGYEGFCTAPMSSFQNKPVNSQGLVDGDVYAEVIEASSQSSR